jgi:hypothetical protein
MCSRPTPVVPASEELKALGTRSLPPGTGDSDPRPSSRPTLSFELDAQLAPATEQFSREEHPTRPDLPSSRPPRAAPRRSRARAIVAKLLFVTLFAGVASLFGVVAKKKLEASGVPVNEWFASLR